MRAACVGVMLLAVTSLAQTDPDEEWESLPASQPAPAPSTVPAPPPLPSPPQPDEADGWTPPPLPPPAIRPARQPGIEIRRAPQLRRLPPPVLEPNRVSVWGAAPMGAGRVGLAVSAGFPWVAARGLVGVSDAVDLGLQVESHYGLYTEGRAVARAAVVRAQGIWFSLQLEGGAAWIPVRARDEDRGPRFLTGRRNFNLSPGLALGFQRPLPMSTRVSVELRYGLGFDIEPLARSPLSGVPSPLALVHSARLRGYVDVPLSTVSCLVVTLGLSSSFDAYDAPLVPEVLVGFVTRV
jgi:hypothetical protein